MRTNSNVFQHTSEKSAHRRLSASKVSAVEINDVQATISGAVKVALVSDLSGSRASSHRPRESKTADRADVEKVL